MLGNSLATDSAHNQFKLPHRQGGPLRLQLLPVREVAFGLLAEDKEMSNCAGKSAAKEKFARSFGLLDEIKQRH